ncbi:MAG: sigma-70 family RNA polymerase sigma factor, partial [Solirubrobacterales bacterium]|nr:sigma-70 family RNA polymerase sigma factor [Solirubrobacterales bacterium]
MASLETLPPDQRAVLDLVLQRGRSYDDIARLLAIDRAAVRARALAAFDQLGPDTGVADEGRALITDYMLGQLPERMAASTRERLACTPSERAWARVLASELAPVAGKPLPEIPDGSAADGPATAERDADAARQRRPRDRGQRRGRSLSHRPSSRRGGAIMLGVGGLAAVALVVVLLTFVNNGSSKHTATPAASGTAAADTAGTSSTSTSGSKAQLVAQNNLNPPVG